MILADYFSRLITIAANLAEILDDYKWKWPLALVGGKTLAELTRWIEVHPNQITEWKRQPSEDIFCGSTAAESPCMPRSGS